MTTIARKSSRDAAEQAARRDVADRCRNALTTVLRGVTAPALRQYALTELSRMAGAQWDQEFDPEGRVAMFGKLANQPLPDCREAIRAQANRQLAGISA